MKNYVHVSTQWRLSILEKNCEAEDLASSWGRPGVGTEQVQMFPYII